MAPRGRRPVDVRGHDGLAPFLYKPAWATLIAGFEAYPRRHQLGSVAFAAAGGA